MSEKVVKCFTRLSQCIQIEFAELFASCFFNCKGQNAIHGARSGWGYGFCFDLSLRQDIRHS